MQSQRDIKSLSRKISAESHNERSIIKV